MQKLVVLVVVLYLCQNVTAYCCFRDPWVLPASSCTSYSSCASPCPKTGSSSCNCGTPCNCFRDPANVCSVCESPSPLCQCMSKCGCDSPKYPIYFPEVEYPSTIIEIDPFYYNTCLCV